MLSPSDRLFYADTLHYDHGGRRGIFDVSLELHAGEIVALVGPNGAGKTTLMECVLGLRNLQAGDCEVAGWSLRRNRRRYLECVGAQLQDETHSPLLTVAETLALHSAFLADPEPAPVLLEAIGLVPWQHTRAGALSSGLRQRLAVALAFLGKPRVVLLDEPTAGVDSEGRELIAGLLGRVAERGGTVLFTTHLREDLAYASRSYSLAAGRLEVRP
ncbi:MAG: ABC transporter ATP-binding protein [Opitutaceae bacterium]|nr:ABC transporter ATP-binding protein [Opitutaceae bacterium]